MNYWLFQGNPDTFDVDSYIAANAEISWTIGQAHLAPEMEIGDEVYLWRASGVKRGDAGIVAAGTITSKPVVRPDEIAAPYWKHGDASKPRLRVGLEIIRRNLGAKQIVKRKWLLDDPVLSGLRILKLASETNYRISANEAQRLSLLVRNTGRDWNRDECVAALWAFKETEGQPVSKLANSPIANIAITIGRAVGGVYNKVMNLRSIDPRDERAGLPATNEKNFVDEDIRLSLRSATRPMLISCAATVTGHALLTFR